MHGICFIFIFISISSSSLALAVVVVAAVFSNARGVFYYNTLFRALLVDFCQ